MAATSPPDSNLRRLGIIELIASNPLPAEEIVDQLRPRAGRRTVYQDLDWLLATFPDHLKRERAGKAHGKYRVTYRWIGQTPYLLEKPITWLTEEELISLVAARGFLRDANADRAPTVTGHTTDLGFIDADAPTKELPNIPLPDGIYEIEVRPTPYSGPTPAAAPSSP